MNTGDNSMDDMASAQKTMRKYGEQLITISQEISEATTVKNAHRMPGKRLRCYLGQSGLRGEALRAEVRHTGKGLRGEGGRLLFVAVWLGAGGFCDHDATYF